MPIIKVEYGVDVQAEAEKIWDILADVEGWPQWQGTSYIRPAKAGPLKEGSAFVAELGGLEWNLSVTKADRPSSICWVGRRLGLEAMREWEFHREGGKKYE